MSEEFSMTNRKGRKKQNHLRESESDSSMKLQMYQCQNRSFGTNNLGISSHHKALLTGNLVPQGRNIITQTTKDWQGCIEVQKGHACQCF